MIKAKAAVMKEIDKNFVVEEFELGAPEKGWALLKMVASGICGTDLHQFKGRLPSPLPIVLGHEMVGTIEEISPEDSKKYGLVAGDKVLSSVAVPCMECALCKMGEYSNCLNFGCTYIHDPYVAPHLYGGYSEYSYFLCQNLFKIPESVPMKTAAVFCCGGPTAINAFKPMREKNFKNIKTAVVQGIGAVGMFAVLYMKLQGVENIIVFNKSFDDLKTETAKNLGATHMISIDDTTEEERLKMVLEITNGIGADLVFEASGNKLAVPEGMNLLRHKGVYIVPGQYSNTDGVLIKPEMITFKALSILGASQYSSDDVKEYLNLLEKNPQIWESVDKVCTHTFRVWEANEALETLQKPESMKILLVGE